MGGHGRWQWRGILGGVCGLLCVLSGISEAQLVLYDTFTASTINPAKWRGQETFSAGDNPNTDALRHITGGQLRVLLRTFGEPLSPLFTITGTQSGRFGLKVVNPESITAMETAITVMAATVQDCPTNPTAATARARLHGYFFNDGTSQRIGDGTGDVTAGIHLQRTEAGLNQIVASISRCTQFDCVSTTTLAHIVFTKTWALAIPVTVQMAWEAANNRFVFRATPSGGTTETRVLSYAGKVPGDTHPPQDNDFKRIIVQNDAANCAAASGRKQAFMDVRFDNVKVNP